MSKPTLFDIDIEAIDEKKTTLASYRGKIMLIVNVASRCGFTRQYADLQKLYKEYESKGLIVLGFPCNQFSHQEPGTNKEIKKFATRCFSTTFPLFAKIDVKGQNQAPIYAYLAKHIEKKPLFFIIPWNFCKILVDKEGNVKKRYLPWTSMKRIRNDIEKLILP